MSIKTFTLGLSVRLIGAAMVWLGDGHTSFVAKATVVLGVILSVGGIAVLRFMLFKSFKDAHVGRRLSRSNSNKRAVDRQDGK